MLQLPLSQGKAALVGDPGFAVLSDFKWCYRGERNSKQGYAVRHHKVDVKDRLLYLHRHLMNPQPGFEVIFLNHDSLDCRPENLRVVTLSEARRHHRVRKDSHTGAKGVFQNPVGNTWSARVFRDGRSWTIDTFKTQAQAEHAYREAMWRENPELNKAPKVVDRGTLKLFQRDSPDAR